MWEIREGVSEDRTSERTPASMSCPCMDARAAKLDSFVGFGGLKYSRGGTADSPACHVGDSGGSTRRECIWV